MAKTITLTFLFGLIMAFKLAMLFCGSPEAVEGINGGIWTVSFMSMGLIMAAGN